eukprot:gene25042-10689_t
MELPRRRCESGMVTSEGLGAAGETRLKEAAVETVVEPDHTFYSNTDPFPSEALKKLLWDVSLSSRDPCSTQGYKEAAVDKTVVEPGYKTSIVTRDPCSNRRLKEAAVETVVEPGYKTSIVTRDPCSTRRLKEAAVERCELGYKTSIVTQGPWSKLPRGLRKCCGDGVNLDTRLYSNNYGILSTTGGLQERPVETVVEPGYRNSIVAGIHASPGALKESALETVDTGSMFHLRLWICVETVGTWTQDFLCNTGSMFTRRLKEDGGGDGGGTGYKTSRVTAGYMFTWRLKEAAWRLLKEAAVETVVELGYKTSIVTRDPCSYRRLKEAAMETVVEPGYKTSISKRESMFPPRLKAAACGDVVKLWIQAFYSTTGSMMFHPELRSFCGDGGGTWIPSFIVTRDPCFPRRLHVSLLVETVVELGTDF